MELLAALAKGLLSALGSKIFNEIFGDKSPGEYFEEMIKEIKSLMHVEVVSNDIVKIKGTIDGIISQITIDYKNLKNSGADDAKLIAFLEPIEASLDQNVMGPLQALTDAKQSKGNSQQSLIVYLLGGGMQFAVLQEMAQHDPKAKADPSKSQYALDIKAYAKKYWTRGNSLLSDIKTSRMASISKVKCMGHVVDEASADDYERPEGEPPVEEKNAVAWPSGTRNYTFSATDGWLDKTVCEFTSLGSIWYPCAKDLDGYTKSTNAYANYVPDQKKKFDTDWADASTTLSAWKELETDPLPSG